MKKITPLLALFLFAMVLFCEKVSGTVFSSNFDDPALTAGIYANNAAVNTGNLNLTVMNSVGAASGYTVQVATSSITSSKVVQLIDNTATAQLAGGLKIDIASQVAASGGYISGSSSFAPLAISSGTRGIFVYAVASGTATSSTTSALQITVNPNLTISYSNGSSSSTVQVSGSSLVLNTGSKYSLQWWVDLSSTVQDTYGFTLYDSNNSLLFSSGTLNTRAANITTTTVYYQAFAGNETGGTYASPDPLVEIQSMSFTAVPEPRSWAILFVGLMIVYLGILRNQRQGMLLKS